MKIGYARVSTKDQNLELQLDALKRVGCDKIFTDKISSAKSKRDGLNQALDFIRPEDTLVVWKLDRLCRSTAELIKISNFLNEKSANLQSVTENIDTTTPTGRMYFTVLGAIAQMERELIQERVMAGLSAARQRGRKGGRPNALTESKKKAARKLLESGMGYKEVAQNLEVGLSTLYAEIPAKSLVFDD